MTSKNEKGRKYIVESLLGIADDGPEVLAIYHEQLYQLGQIIKQREPLLFDEITRTFANETAMAQIKVKLNRQRRK